jgi:hypothetical protein
MAQNPPGPPGAPPGGGYPPPPPGGGYPPAPAGGGYPQQAQDPYAAERALNEWAQAKGYALGNTPDLAWYQGWAPFVYLPRLARVGRELRVEMGDARAFIVEGYEADAVKQAAGEDRCLCSFVMSQRLAARAAIRSKTGGGVVNEIKSGFGSLFSSGSAGGVLGDPTFEGRFDVSTPSREEGNRALPMPLRQHLLQYNWRGILETRPGGMAAQMYDATSFNVQTLEWTLSTLGYLYQLAAG